MTVKGRSTGGFRISPIDRRGRLIIPPVLNAADSISRRAIHYAEGLSIDSAIAANLLEEAAATVSRTMMRKQINEDSIQDLDSYLFRAFLRRLNRKYKTSLPTADSFHVNISTRSNSVDPRTLFENKILIDEFLMHCDPLTRDIFCHRLEGRSWKEIGRAFGISRRAAESRFNQRLQRVRKRLRLK